MSDPKQTEASCDSQDSSDERIKLMTYKEGQLPFFSDFLLWAVDWCEENGYTDARVENSPDGDVITAVRK